MKLIKLFAVAFALFLSANVAMAASDNLTQVNAMLEQIAGLKTIVATLPDGIAKTGIELQVNSLYEQAIVMLQNEIVALGGKVAESGDAFKAKSTTAVERLSGGSAKLIAGKNSLLKFKVSAWRGNVGLRKFTLNLEPFGAMVGDLNVFVFTDEKMTKPFGRGYLLKENMATLADLSKVVIVPQNSAGASVILQVPKDGAVYFNVVADIKLMSNGAYVKTSLLPDEYALGKMLTTIEAERVANYVWSPNTGGGTSLSSVSDWANGYGVKEMSTGSIFSKLVAENVAQSSFGAGAASQSTAGASAGATGRTLSAEELMLQQLMRGMSGSTAGTATSSTQSAGSQLFGQTTQTTTNTQTNTSGAGATAGATTNTQTTTTTSGTGVAAGTFTVLKHSSSPGIIQDVNAGARGVTMGSLELRASGESIELRKLAVKVTTGSYTDVEKIYLVERMTDTTIGSATLDNSTDVIVLSSPLTLQKDYNKVLDIKVDVAVGASVSTAASSHLLKIDHDGFATGESRTQGYGKSSNSTIYVNPPLALAGPNDSFYTFNGIRIIQNTTGGSTTATPTCDTTKTVTTEACPDWPACPASGNRTRTCTQTTSGVNCPTTQASIVRSGTCTPPVVCPVYQPPICQSGQTVPAVKGADGCYGPATCVPPTVTTQNAQPNPSAPFKIRSFTLNGQHQGTYMPGGSVMTVYPGDTVTVSWVVDGVASGDEINFGIDNCENLGTGCHVWNRVGASGQETIGVTGAAIIGFRHMPSVFPDSKKQYCAMMLAHHKDPATGGVLAGDRSYVCFDVKVVNFPTSSSGDGASTGQVAGVYDQMLATLKSASAILKSLR